MFIPSQLSLKRLAACCGVVSLLFAAPVTVIAEESSNHQVLLAQSSELERAKQQARQAAEQIDAGNWEEAVTLLEQALPIYQKTFGSEHSIVKALEQLLKGANLAQAGQTEEAKAAFEQAVNLFEELEARKNDNQTSSSTPQSPELEETKRLNQQAYQLYQQGKYNEAIAIAERVLEMRRKLLGDQHPDVATSLNNLAFLYSSQGRYSEAEPLYIQALEMARKLLGDEHPHVATSLNNLALLYRSQGRYSEAEPLLRQALEMRRKLLGDQHPDVAGSLNNLAGLYWSQGRYNQAESLLIRALEMSQKLLGNEHPVVATSLNNLARLYDSQGRYSEAEPLYRRALEMRQKLLGEEHPDVALSLNNLANLYSSQGRYSEAEPLLMRALEMYRKLLGDEHPYVATSLNSLANLYSSQGRYSEAEPLLMRALEMRQKLLGDEHPDVAQSLNNLAGLYSSQGRYSEAEPLYIQALEMYRKLLGDQHPDVATSLNNLAQLYLSQGDTTQAITYLSRGLEVQEQNLNILLATGSERQKQDSMNTLSGTTYAAISFHLQEAPNNSEAARLALTTILRRKARILDTVTNELQLIRENITPENQQILDELDTIQQQRASLLYNPPEDLPPEQYRQLTENLRAEAEQLEAQLAQRSAEFRVETEPVTIEKLQQLIPEDTALVEIIQYKPFDAKAQRGERYGKPHYAAYIISANNINWVDLGEAEPIDQKVNKFRQDLGEQRASVERSARELDEIVMQPIREKLGDKTHILISPDGQLNLIPFAALMDENNEYLVKNYLFTYLTTGRDLLRLQLDAPSRQDPVMLANPNYEEPGNSTGVQLASNPPFPVGEGLGERSSSKIGRGTNQRSSDFDNLAFGPLKGTQLEADAIQPIVPNLQVFTGSEATENLLEQLQAPRILHIATHGFFLEDIECTPATRSRGTPDGGFKVILNPDYQPDCKPTPSNLENPLLRSGLALAGFNPRESGDKDGVLTASEVTRLKLYGTELVVLSACDTGVGSVRTGEGVYGLRRAFVKSGAESQLMSLWKVDDHGTSELMSMYYQRLKNGEARSQAMRQVQLELLQAPFYEHPYYWASFIFSGDWRPTESF
jgi:CHAT domain-containing protein